ncbi:MAG: transglutaminase domain-containing protein [Bacteroidaceae bacterium]|nr:transglutaminase domain-containing protein [Bacteroidaceae bacterium]
MKKIYTILTLALSTVLFPACTSDSDRLDINLDNQESVTRIEFPESDGSRDLSTMSSTIAMARVLFTKAGREAATTLGRHISITDEEYQEIADFTSELVAGGSNEQQKYNKIFSWITGNIKYEHGDQRPYSVFTNKKGVCQGYADLLTVMCHTQQIPCVTVNGMVVPYGGHAWNYLNCDGVWHVSDPTNGGKFKMNDTTGSYNHLEIHEIQATLFEDELCTYSFYNSALNVESIKDGNTQIVIPYSVENIVISSVNPTWYVSEDVKELYLGKNITSVEKEGTSSLSTLAKGLEVVVVDPENKVLESFSNVIYRDGQMNFIAPAVNFIELRPVEFDKESKLKNLPKLESIVFAPGTKSIGAWAVEYCPMLHTAYIPNDTEVHKNAFSGVAADFQIIRGDYTNIPQIKED